MADKKERLPKPPRVDDPSTEALRQEQIDKNQQPGGPAPEQVAPPKRRDRGK